MIFTTPMVHLTAVVLDHDSDKITKELLNQGVLDFIKVSEIKDGSDSRIHPLSLEISEGRIKESRKRIESFLRLGERPGIRDISLDISAMTKVKLEDIEKKLDEVADTIEGFRAKQREQQQEILKLEDIRRQMDMFGNIRESLSSQSSYSFLSVKTGTIPAEQIPEFSRKLKKYPSVQLELKKNQERIPLLIVSLKRDDKSIQDILGRFSWVPGEMPEQMSPQKTDVLENLDAAIADFRGKQEQVAQELNLYIEGQEPELHRQWQNLRMNELYQRIQSYFSRTSRTILFTGWLPKKSQPDVDRAIRQASGNACYMEWHIPGKDAVFVQNQEKAIPVSLKNPRALQPFQLLVENYSLPEYGTIDPTPFVAVAYLSMFGLMFGDAGHGTVLVLLGFLGGLLMKKAKPGIKKLLQLIMYCGGASIITGILFGSYFGRPLFPPVWFNYHGIIAGHSSGSRNITSIYDILEITIYFGIGVIGLGLILNWINCIARKRWLQLIFDKAGILGGWIFGVGVYTAFYFVQRNYKQLPPLTFLALAVGLPCLALFLKAPLHNRGKEDLTVFSLLNYFMEWIVELLEVFSGYLANTLSFMRVAGLGIAHVSLMIAFDQIARMMSPGGDEFTFTSYIILVLGNVLVIALEGLSAGIQSLRLNYYEFFSKYFSGTGKAYAPVSLKSRDQEE